MVVVGLLLQHQFLSDRFAIKYDIKNPELSVAWTIMCLGTKLICAANQCDYGGNTAQAGCLLEREGTRLEECWPMSTILTYGQSPECPNINQNCCGDNNKAGLIFKAEPNSTQVLFIEGNQKATEMAIKHSIQYQGPVVTSFEIDNNFMYNFWDNRGGDFDLAPIYKNTGIKPDGGHAICITGWNDEERYWECRNSWGFSNQFFKWTMNNAPVWNKKLKRAIIGPPPIIMPNMHNNDLLGGVITFIAGDLPTGYTSQPSTGGKTIYIEPSTFNLDGINLGLIIGIIVFTIIMILIIIICKKKSSLRG